jgi:hypothetical protein
MADVAARWGEGGAGAGRQHRTGAGHAVRVGSPFLDEGGAVLDEIRHAVGLVGERRHVGADAGEEAVGVAVRDRAGRGGGGAGGIETGRVGERLVGGCFFTCNFNADEKRLPLSHDQNGRSNVFEGIGQ